MRKEFLQLPAQAVMADLYNVQPLGKVSIQKINKNTPEVNTATATFATSCYSC